MNPQIEADLNLLIDEADEKTGPSIALLVALVDEYESGDFSNGWGGTIPAGLHKHLTPKALVALIRVYHYLNELIRVAYANRAKRDSPVEGNS